MPPDQPAASAELAEQSRIARLANAIDRIVDTLAPLDDDLRRRAVRAACSILDVDVK